MKTLAIVDPTGLTAKELREQLERRPELWRELRLLATADDQVGTLTDVAGAAAVVQRLDAEALAGVDLAFFCGPAAATRAALPLLPAGAQAVLLAADGEAGDAPPCVAGVSESIAGPVVASPQPGAVLLAHLLHPLLPHGLRRAEATLLQPVSAFPPEALDQLFEQARSLLTFQPLAASPHWERQLAFNLQPTASRADSLVGQLAAVLGDGPALSVQIVQAGVFHGLSASVHLAFEPDPGAAALREALSDRPWLRWADQEGLGPVDAAAAEEVLLGHLHAARERGGGYWAWCVMDNLTRGGASNAIALAEALLG